MTRTDQRDRKHLASDTPASPAVSATVAPASARAAGVRRGRRGLVVAVLVVLLGGVIAYGGGRMLTNQVPVLALARDVPAGAVISDSDLVVVEMPNDPNVKSVAAGGRSAVVGGVAQVPLFAGGLLTAGQVGASDGFTAGEQMLALPVKVGQMPAAGVTPGRHVLLVATPPSGPVTQDANEGGESIAATVAHVAEKDAASGITVVDVRVAADSAERLARIAATGDFAVVLLPPGR